MLLLILKFIRYRKKIHKTFYGRGQLLNISLTFAADTRKGGEHLLMTGERYGEIPITV